jgi:hypothetical protein
VAIHPSRIVEEEQRRIRPKEDRVPVGWAGNGPSASFSVLNVSSD